MMFKLKVAKQQAPEEEKDHKLAGVDLLRPVAIGGGVGAASVGALCAVSVGALGATAGAGLGAACSLQSPISVV
ncbi:unnamed protein product, partial [Rotaria sp. Silwood2]